MDEREKFAREVSEYSYKEIFRAMTIAGNDYQEEVQVNEKGEIVSGTMMLRVSTYPFILHILFKSKNELAQYIFDALEDCRPENILEVLRDIKSHE